MSNRYGLSKEQINGVRYGMCVSAHALAESLTGEHAPNDLRIADILVDALGISCGDALMMVTAASVAGVIESRRL